VRDSVVQSFDWGDTGMKSRPSNCCWTAPGRCQTAGMSKAGRIGAHGFSPKVIWGFVKQAGAVCSIGEVAPNDLRRTCARLCHERGGELEQIQFLLGHLSVQTTDRYLGCKQRLRDTVNDSIGIEPAPIHPVRFRPMHAHPIGRDDTTRQPQRLPLREIHRVSCRLPSRKFP
jgi:hypothetical protein